MERFGSVEALAVQCTDLIGVQVTFSAPEGAVPMLAVAGVA